MKYLTIFFVLMFTSLSFASTQVIYWQKLLLEEKVENKISNALNTVLSPNQFIVNVEVEVDEPSGPNFKDNKGGGLKVSDVNLSDSRGDYIAFSKVGLEVPVLDKYFEEDKTKLLNLYRFNEAYDIFRSLQKVKVTVFLSESLPSPLYAIAEKVVQSTKLSLGTVKPAFAFEKIALEWIDPAKKAEAKKEEQKAAEEKRKKEEPVEPKIWTKDWLEWASRWGNAFGLILSALIITFLALSLFKRWKEFMETQSPKEDTTKEEAVADEEKSSEAMSEEEAMASDNGFERFKVCLSQYPVEASNLSREWIAANSSDSKLALRAVAQQLDSEDFAKLLTSLGQEQREAWKGVIGAYLAVNELKEANKIIARDVVRALLVPARVKDTSLLNLLMELGPVKISQFLEQKEHLAGIMLNLLSPSVTGSILNSVSDQKVENWLTQAATFNIEKLEESGQELKKSLQEYKQSLAPSHFNARIAELILSASPSKERMLFKSMAKASGADEVIRVAKQLFPSELLLKLPESFLKETLQSYPMAKRLELIISQNEANRDRLLNSFAEAGTPAREMMDMEMESINNDAGRVSNIQSRSEEIWREYVYFARQSLERSSQYRPDSERLITEWARTLGKGLKVVGNNVA